MILTGISRFFAAVYQYDPALRRTSHIGGRLICDAGKYTVNISTEVLTLFQGGIPSQHLERFTGGELVHDSLEQNGAVRMFLFGEESAEVLAGMIRTKRYGVGEKSIPPFLGFGTIYEICDPDSMKTLYQPVVLPKVKYLKTSVESVATREAAPTVTPTEYTARVYPEDSAGEWIWRFEAMETEAEAEAVIKGVLGMMESWQ